MQKRAALCENKDPEFILKSLFSVQEIKAYGVKKKNSKGYISQR